MDHYRQGDLLIRRIAALPSTAERASDSILARGEVTGHSHRLVGDATLSRDLDSQAVFVQVMSSASVIHEEHGTITLGSGAYEVVRQREYTPARIVTIAD